MRRIVIKDFMPLSDISRKTYFIAMNQENMLNIYPMTMDSDLIFLKNS